MALLWMLLLAIFCFVRQFNALEAIEYTNSSAILSKLLENYEKNIIPNKAGQPLDVYIQIYISDMVPLRNLHMHYSTDIFLRQNWIDARLAFDKSDNMSVLILPGTAKEKIWIPDLYFPYGKEARIHEATTLNSAMHIYGNGEVFYSQRLTLTSFCPMNFIYFPFDVQQCDFCIGSYGYNANFLHLHWRKKDPILQPNQNTNLYMREFSQAKYSLEKIEKLYTGLGKTKGSFILLKIVFTFYRNIAAHILRDYLPSILTVILSWLSFWIDYRSTPSRVALGITTVLTMVTLLTSSNDEKQSESVFRSMDLYLFVCNVYVFSALIEYAVVGIIEARSVAKQGKKIATKNGNGNSIELAMLNLIAREGNAENYLRDNFTETQAKDTVLVSFDEELSPPCKGENSSARHNFTKRKKDSAKCKDDFKDDVMLKLANIITYDMERKMVEPHRLDKLCRVVYPCSFVLLNVAYFIFHYCTYD